jgi:PAS domain S-box-containing protein
MAIVWTLLMAGIFAINVHQHRQMTTQTAVAEARLHFEKDQAFRAWGTLHGGVYVPVSEQTPPNPHLNHVPERDITTPAGKKLTLINPAYMIRQVFTISSEKYGLNEHITSLQFLNPDNSPDAWEKDALTAFDQGSTEVFEFLDINGAPHLRLMMPMLTTEGCLKCHAQQGYKVGDIRGGITVSLPMATLLESEHYSNITALLSLGTIWLFGLASLLFGRGYIKQRVIQQTQTEKTLEALHSLHDEAQRIAHLGHWTLDLITNRLQWSQEVFRIFGKDPKVFQPSLQTFQEGVHPDDREMVMQAYDHSVQTRTPCDISHRLLMEDGSIKYVREQGETVYDNAGTPLRSTGTMQDVTPQLLIERSLRQSEERLQLVLLGGNLGMWDTDIPTGKMIINDRWAEMLGYRKEEIEPGLDGWKNLVHPDDLPAVLEAITDHFEGRTLFYENDHRLRTKSGQWKWIHAVGQIVSHDASGKPIRATGIHVDITKNKELEQRVVQQERLSAIGQLTAGIAHDFNNTLTSILGFAQLLDQSPTMPEQARKDIAIIISSGKRAAHLVQQMLDFSRQSIRRPRALDLTPFLKEIIKFLRSIIPETIHLHLDIEPGDYLIQGDPAQIQQLLTNLVINARDAMPKGGDLPVKLGRVKILKETTCFLCQHPIRGEWITITVTDTGTGISPELLARIFEPFFTTKEVGKGSGLGLAQVFGITKQHGGHLTVSSEPGQGTSFVIYLPPIMPGGLEAEAPTADQITMGQGETILFVEDEPLVREAMQSMLQHLNYRVLTATNGQEALEIYAAHQETSAEPVAMVISDMVMPEMDGAGLFYALQAINPAIKCVLMSGYDPEGKREELLEQGLTDWFQKPLSLEALSAIIGKAMGGR